MLFSDTFLVVLKKGEKICSYCKVLCAIWGILSEKKKLPLLHEALCDNYFIVAWNVLNHMDRICRSNLWAIFVVQTRGSNLLVICFMELDL